MQGNSGAESPRLLVLGAGAAQLGLLEAARQRGLFVIAVDRDPSAPGFSLADRRALISTEDEPAIQRLAEAEAIDGVIAPGTDWPVGIAARVAERLALPHPIDSTAAALSTSKPRQRERFVEAGVPHVPWRLAAEANADLSFPCVVKAADRQGQRGLTLVHDWAELAAAVERAIAESRSGVALCEELVEGPELTVSGFSVEGTFYALLVSERLSAEPPAFGVALAQLAPAAQAAGAAGIARRAAEALGIRQGATYTQIRIAADGPRVIELAAGLGGGHEAELCEAAVGIDLNALALRAALGEPIAAHELEPRAAGGACVRFLVAAAGELREVRGAEQAAAAAGVRWVRLYRRPGDEIAPLRGGADRVGAVLAVGADAEEALERALRAADSIRFETVDAELLLEARPTA